MNPPTQACVPASAIGELSPEEARAAQVRGALLIDVREASECASGMAEGAINVPRGQLDGRMAELCRDPDQAIVVICAIGQRSRVAAATLYALGYHAVSSVSGGLARWKRDGLPLADDGLDADARERYARQLCLPQVGVAGQRRLAAARVALIGAGGLGSPAALYLAAAGVGRLSLIDDDVVERSNLHRQVLHTDARVGVAKVESARTALAALNPAIGIDAVRERLTAANVERLLHGHDVVIDGSDNFPTRYLLAAASRHLRLPMIYGAVERFSGQISVFDPRREDSPCYRCLFPEPPGPDDAPNCSEAGVLGVLPGMVGMMQATEALKLILGIGEPLIGHVLCFDALSMQFHRLQLARDPQCPGCGPDAHTSALIDLSAPACSTQS